MMQGVSPTAPDDRGGPRGMSMAGCFLNVILPHGGAQAILGFLLLSLVFATGSRPVAMSAETTAGLQGAASSGRPIDTGSAKGQRYSAVIIHEARVRDLAGQARRSLLYAKQARIDISSEERNFQSLKPQLRALDQDLQVGRDKNPDYRNLNYQRLGEELSDLEKTLERLLSLVRGALGRATQAVPPVGPMFSGTGTGGTSRLFIETSRPNTPNQWEIIKPFGFDVLAVDSRPKAISLSPPQFELHTASKSLTQVTEHGYRAAMRIQWGLKDAIKLAALAYEDGEELYLQDAEGRSKRVSVHPTINIWHPWIREYVPTLLGAMGNFGKDQPGLAHYRLINEPDVLTGLATPADYGRFARSAFQDHLKQRYGEIAQLNAIWGTSYKSFQEITPPARLSGVRLTEYLQELAAARTTAESVNVRAHRLFRIAERLGQQAPRKHEIKSLMTQGNYEGAAQLIDRALSALTSVGKGPSFGQRPGAKGKPPFGLIYEFQTFRSQGLVQFFDAALRILKRADPHHRVTSEFAGWFNGSLPDAESLPGLDFLALASLGWDLYGSHDGGDGRLPALLPLYHYSINRYTGHPLWTDEFWWAAWEAKVSNDERLLRAVAERNLWRQLAWGKRGVSPQYLSGPRPAWNDKVLNDTDEIMRYSTGVWPVIMQKARMIERILFQTEITHQGIALLQPSTTLKIIEPLGASKDHAIIVCDWLLSHHYLPFIVPEEVILDGREDLSRFRVMIVPYAPYILPELSRAVLKWVEKGGVLITVGVFGAYDQYGREEGRFATRVFGSALPQVTRTMTASYGKGKVVMTPMWGVKELLHAIEQEVGPLKRLATNHQARFYTLAEAKRFGTPLNRLAYNDIELLLLNDKGGTFYLFVINLDPEQPKEVQVGVKGRFDQIIDLFVEGGVPVPHTVRADFTHFVTSLRPGEGVLFHLGRDRGKVP